ncbi:uncharacterized protein LOC120704178 isoform X2 [Panicum virgatum]|uniref:Disease resistance R13L4/SHOC-2-like LRR domain-containing protein n=1 Tax=Panicum virgatum TaxID=38727 RepID=A0A8T0XHY1_PANVG|nr:uncharacterized protein LOC120704178 isoform X2 [Panicum virgatum]KAG2658967.1 hypothetical protein PVAP13_1KG330600 [Panicum virgatum]
MAEPGKETIAPPLSPLTSGPAPPVVMEPGGETQTTTPPPPPQEAEPIDGGVASAFDAGLPTAEPARQALPQEKPDADAAAAGQPQQLTTEEGRQPPPTPTDKAEEVVATLPPPSETPSQETAAAAAVEAEKQLPATPAPAPPQQQRPEGGAAEEASSVRQEEKDAAPPVKKQEGEEKLGEEAKRAEPARVVREGRRRWRHLQAAVRLVFLRCSRRAPRGEQSAPPQSPLLGNKGGDTKPPAPAGELPMSRLEEKKPALADEGDMKPPAPVDGKQPASGQEGQVTSSPPPAEASSLEMAAPAAEAGKPLAARPQQQPPQEQEGGGAPEQASSVQEEEKDAAPAARVQEAREEPARRRWRWLRAAVNLLFLRPQRKDTDGEAKPPAPSGKHAVSGLEDKKQTTPAEMPAAADGKQAPPSGQDQEEEKPKPPHPKWREEERLEQILEGAFTRLLASEYHQLSSIRQKCLLTFSVFELASEVKKQVMVYWWASQFNLQHRSDDRSAADVAPPAEMRRSKTLRRRPRKAAAPAAGGNHSPTSSPPQGEAKDGGRNPDAAAEGVFSELSSHGFLEPMKNWCTKGIHGCRVNPLVHWMLKRRARDDGFADLDANGSPAERQPNSSILCLTAGNRYLLQRMRMEDESQQVENKEQPKTRTTTSLHSPTQDNKAPAQDLKNFKGKQVILNLNAHVYPVSKSMFLHLADYLVVLQLGRWRNLDDNTYMEVDGLESLSTISLLKNLRYLSLRGLSRLTELPEGIRWLKKLAILDMRGCQNLVNVSAKITRPLKQLTHLDLTECYMLEHIERGITSLSELQVFKGFVFATGTQGSKACQLQDLRRLKKLQKLTISITTDANIGKNEMAELKHLFSLRKLTIIWSEIPSILHGDSDAVKKRRNDLVEKWTSFELPQELLKLDLRCYPKNELKLKEHKNLKKLYLRGGDLKRFSIDGKTNSIKTLRVRYLKDFNMEWEEIHSLLKDIENVEIVLKDEKLMKDADKDQMDKNDVNGQKDIEEESNLVKPKKISYSCLDENGVWVKDNKEEENRSSMAQATKEKEAHGTMEKSKGPIEDPSTKAASSTVEDVNKDDNNNAIKEQ